MHSRFPTTARKVLPRQTSAAIACRLLANLDQYEQLVEQAAINWPARHSVSQIAPLVEAMRTQAVCLPQLSAMWIAFLASHNQMLQLLAACESTSVRLDALEAHIDTLLDLEGKCLEVATLKRAVAKGTADV